eukprot:9929008-Lingulodinium_polyedra.AAC.1
MTANAHLGIRMCDFPDHFDFSQFKTWEFGSCEVSLRPESRTVPFWPPREHPADPQDPTRDPK